MIGTLGRLQRSEEGQTLVLAAVFGLILMLCVLGTVNLGRAVYDKVQLQSAADSSAYSLAAVEARVMNFTAYTNRAMVVHYASLMAATSYLTWVHFIWAGLKPLLTVLRAVPYIGPIIQVIQQVLQALVRVLDIGVAALAPLLSFANMYLYALQEGAWTAVYARLLKSIQPEAHSGDSARQPYVPIWPELIPLANATVFSQTRGSRFMLENTREALGILVNANNPAVQQARLHMLEIANSARQPWTAYGDRYSNPSISPLARHFKWGFDLGIAALSLGSVGRTEMGSYAPRNGLLGGLRAAPPQVWSGQRLQLRAKLGPLTKNTNLFSFVAMDDVYAPDQGHLMEFSYYLVWNPPGWLTTLFPAIKGVMKGIKQAFKSTAPNPDWRPFWMSPYVYFAPRAHSAPEAGPLGRLGNFAQPDVVVGLALEGRDYNREEGAARYYGRRFSWGGGGAGSGAVDFGYTDKDWPRIPGLPGRFQLLHRGLNAFSAAQVYYHRPGDWKEMPNFFNPLWGARLMPVIESNALARTGLSAAPALRQFLLH